MYRGLAARRGGKRAVIASRDTVESLSGQGRFRNQLGDPIACEPTFYHTIRYLVRVMKKIDRYELLDELGHGGMGTVYRAFDPRLDRIVAIKTLRTDSGAEPAEVQSLLERFSIEARAAAGLTHPNIVVIYDYGECEKRPYIVMEFIEGTTVEQLLRTLAPLAASHAMRILTETAKALDHAHSRGILHRDVKPGNLMIRRDGAIKLTDFGIARISRLSGVTRTGFIVGSPHYLSPESFRNSAVDARSDQYSLGVLAWELLTGAKPFAAESVDALMFQVVFGDRPIVTKFNPALTQEAVNVFQKVLASTCEQRYQSCEAFVDALGDAISTSRIEKVWYTLQYSVDSGALERFIHTYPDSSFAEIARLRLPADQSIAGEWKILAANPEPIGIRTFLGRYPNCPQSSRARALLEDLEARSWLELGNHPTNTAIELFLRQFPDGRFAGQARAELTSVQTHDADWAQAEKDANSEALRRFVAKHPNSMHVEKALKRISAIDAGQDRAQESAAIMPAQDEPLNSSLALVIAGRQYPVLVGMRLFENDVPGVNAGPCGRRRQEARWRRSM